MAVGVGAGVLIPVLAAATPAAAATPTVSCTSAKAGLAAKLKKDITAALATRKGTVAVGLYDRTTKTTCTLRATSAYDSASTVKVTVLATLLWDAKKHNRTLTTRESTLAKAMITKSDNDATSTLWKQLGLTKIKGFLTAAGMTQTKPGANNYWGLTQETVTDEQKLLSLVTAKNTVLSDNSRAYILMLMNQVISSQRWGTRPEPLQCHRARQERLAAALHARLARPQPGHLQRRRPRLHDVRAHPGQQHDELRHHHDPGCREGDPQGPRVGPVLGKRFTARSPARHPPVLR